MGLLSLLSLRSLLGLLSLLFYLDMAVYPSLLLGFAMGLLWSIDDMFNQGTKGDVVPDSSDR